MTINKSKLFTMAWKGFKTQVNSGKNASFSKSLKWAWSVLKSQSQSQAVSVKFSKETEKAAQVTIRLVCPFTDQSSIRNVWIPKSLIKNGAVDTWFWDKKIKEVKNTINYSAASSLLVEVI